jgi:hypothetical protein
MKRLLLAVLFAVSASAHPGVGIVVDSRGNIFYTDLRQIWRIAANGATGVAVPNVHSHELYVDKDDNVYGEHVWYNGEQLNTWGSRVWKRSPNGNVVDVIPTHAGFNDRFGFARDAAGNMYVVRRPDQNTTTIAKCAATCIPFGAFRFHNIRFLTATPPGTLYVVDLVDIVRVAPDGRATVIASNISSKHENHQVMGIWTDRDENVYVAVYGDSVVKRIDQRGRVTIVYRSSFPWAPSGGTFDRSGDMLVLETKMNVGDVTRVRRVKRSPSGILPAVP